MTRADFDKKLEEEMDLYEVMEHKVLTKKERKIFMHAFDMGRYFSYLIMKRH